ncbi:MAG TPA: hypothetical protein VE963_08815, partial [Reyranella sp.]|nr:hypothetical protein [Reyranella sp.]
GRDLHQRPPRQGGPGARHGAERGAEPPVLVCRLCQQWVDEHPSAVSPQQIAAGLLSVLNSLSDGDAGQLSRHLSGDAFDVQPVLPDIDGIMVTIRTLKGLHQFLEKEAGLDRWHAEFEVA